VVLLVDASPGDAPVQDLEPLLALTTADDLADPGASYIHRRDGPAVVVHSHVEGFDDLA